MLKKTLTLVATIVAFSALAADPAVKKSDSGICHDASSSSYGNTKKFTPFNTIDECVKSGESYLLVPKYLLLPQTQLKSLIQVFATTRAVLTMKKPKTSRPSIPWTNV